MTVSTEVNHNEYYGNGSTTNFPYTFRIYKPSDLVVVVTNADGMESVLVLGTDYIVTGAGSYNGGAVITTTPLQSGVRIVISRELAAVQETDLRNQGSFFAEVHEDAFDYLTMLIQQALYGVDVLSRRAIRVPESSVSLTPNVANRRNKIFAWDNNGQPISLLPESGSAADVLLELLKPNGTNNINGTKYAFGTVPRNLTSMLTEFITLHDFGGVDDYNGSNLNSATNNLQAIKKYFEFLNSIGGGVLNITKSPSGTGKYMVNGDDHTQVLSSVKINAEENVSLHLLYSGGSANSPLVNTGLLSNRQITVEYINFGFTSFIGANVQRKMGEILPTLNNGDGVFSKPKSLSGVTDFKLVSLSNINVAISPASTSADSLSYLGGGTQKAAVISASPGDEFNSLISSPSSGVFFAGVITALGYAYLAQDSGTQEVKLVDGTDGLPAVLQGVPYALLDQQRDNFNNALITVKVTSSRTFSVLVNGLTVYSYTTRSAILGACFGSENINDTVNISQMSKVTGRSFSGSKPLKIIICGDSISDTNVQYSHAKYLQMILGSAGINIAEINNIAVSGENAAQQYARLQTIGSGYDLCLIQVGVNDVQGQTPFSSFVSTISGMVNYSKQIGAQPIVAIPTAFYSKAEANANGQSGGQDTQHNDTLHTYRSLLIRAVADSGGLLNEETMKGYGAMTAKWLSLTPYAVSDRIVVDNIHPSPYGSMMIAQGWARSILGWLCRPDTTSSEEFEPMPNYWLTSGFGLISKPKLRGRELSGLISLNSTGSNDGAVAFTLPPAIRIDAVKMVAVTGVNTSGNPVATCNFYVHPNGKCYFFNLTSGITQVSLDGVKL